MEKLFSNLPFTYLTNAVSINVTAKEQAWTTHAVWQGRFYS